MNKIKNLKFKRIAFFLNNVCNIIHVFTVNLVQFNACLLNKLYLKCIYFDIFLKLYSRAAVLKVWYAYH